MDENQSNLPDQSLPGAAQLTATGGAAAVDETLSLAELNQLLGKNYKDKTTALSAVKETYSFVGRKIDAANPAPTPADPNLASEVQSLKVRAFYAENPDYKGHEDIIKAMGSDPLEVVKTNAFKTYFEKAKVADQVTKAKSVVSSNSRLGQSSSVMDDAVKVANATGSTERTADVLAKGIIEELGL